MTFYPSARSQTAISTGLAGKVFGLLSFSLVFAAIGGVIGARFAQGWLLPLVILEFVLIFAIHAFRERDGINLGLLYAFTFVSGMTLGPLIAAYIGAGLGFIVLEAGVITGVMTAGLGAYALTTKRDFSGIGAFLFVGLIGLVVASFIGIFIGGSLFNGLLGFGGAVLFSFYLVFEVQRAKYAADTMGNAVVITLGIYLTIVNLFLSLLRLLSALQGGGSRRN